MGHKLYPLGVFFLFIFSLGFAQSPVNTNQRQQDSLTYAWHQQVLNKPLPAFLAAGDDGVVNNDSLKGKITYINIWESSCAPCMAEMSALNKLYDTLIDNSAFQFISLSSDNMQTINRIKEKYHIRYNVAHLDQEGCFQLNGGMGYPTSIITDMKGNVIYTHAGGYTDSASIWHFIFSGDIYPLLYKQLH
jgi:thiol-disulfide isomerase/thioredoxin